MGVVGQRHAPAALYPRERPGTHFVGDRVGLRAGLDRCGKSQPHKDSITGPSSLCQVAIPTELFRPTVYPDEIQIADFPTRSLITVPLYGVRSQPAQCTAVYRERRYQML
jgi:hypothetical protein